jgi:hypothetical protein
MGTTREGAFSIGGGPGSRPVSAKRRNRAGSARSTWCCGHCRRYIDVIDAEWNRIVEWFTGPPGKSVITPEQVAEMNQRWRLPTTDAAVAERG